MLKARERVQNPLSYETDDTIVDDQSWKTRVDSATSPDRPRWLDPLFTDE